MSRAKIIDFYLEKAQNEGFEIDEVRRDLQKNNFDEEEIKVIVRLVDNEMQRRMFRKTEGKKSSPLISIGLIITAIGAGITVSTYTGLINTGNYFILAYGPFLSGLAILVTGLARRKS